MTITRRRFIGNLGTAAISVVSLSATAEIFGQTNAAEAAARDNLFAVPPESFADPLNYLSRAHFEPFVDTFVQIQTGEKRIQMRLVEVSELKRAANESRAFRGESFSLLFEDEQKSRLTQGVYKVEHADLGEFDLLLTPTGLKQIRYEAVINRIGR